MIDGKKGIWPFMQFGYYYLTLSFNSEGGKPNFCGWNLCEATVTLFVMKKFYLAFEVAWLQLLKQSTFLKISKIFMLFHFFKLENSKTEY